MKQLLIAATIAAACSTLAPAQTALVPPDQGQGNQDQELAQRVKQLEAWRDQQVKPPSIPSSVAGIPVTIYGVADLYLEQGNNGINNIQRLQSGGINGSRLGFKGSDEIWGGLNSVYCFEMGINLNAGTSGQGGTLFGRQAWAGLQGKWGTLTGGRIYDPLFWTDVLYGLGGGLAWGNASNYFFDPSVANRLNNSINYVSPQMLGVTLKGFYSLGESSQAPGQINNGNIFNVSGQYDRGPLSLNYSYLTRQTTSTKGGIWKGMGASYDFSVVKVALLYQTQYDESTPMNNEFYEASATVPLGNGSLLLDYGATQNKLVSNANAKSPSVRYDYNLTKRTAIYGGFSKISNQAKANFGIVGATGSSLTIAAGESTRSIVLGTRIFF